MHSTHSDGTGTVAQIARAAEKAGVDVVLLTDHDTLGAKRAGEEGWHGDALVLVGEEVTPADRDHFLAFGIDNEIPRKLTGPEICAAVEAAGGFGFAAHPFSRGSRRFKRAAIPFDDLDCVAGVELWSFLNDTGERLGSVRDLVRMVLAPQSIIGSPPPENLREWDRLCQTRKVVGIGGLDAHQFGVRVAGRVPLRMMSYRRSFLQLRTHVLVPEPLNRDLDHDRALVYDALREGRCYIAVDALATANGFEFTALQTGTVPICYSLRARLPQRARVRIVRDGAVFHEADADSLDLEVDSPGVYRLEAELRGRTWILSNPAYLR